jgi:hypothetical protein
MSNAPENPRDENTTPSALPEAMPVTSSVNESVAQQPPFSKLVIWGFIVSLISLIVFGMLGALGAVLARHGLRAVKAGTARGRGLAIAAIVMGSVAVAYYLFNAIANNLL